MSIRQPSAPYGRTVMCLPLVKYSFATVTPNMTSVPWSHKQAVDLDVLVEHVGIATDTSLQLRVVQASETLECIPLTRLVSAASSIQKALEATSGPFAKIENLPIFAMFKDKALAIRYNKPTGESRRTQMNFGENGHLRQLLSMLQGMGMATTEIKPKGLSRLSNISPALTPVPVAQAAQDQPRDQTPTVTYSSSPERSSTPTESPCPTSSTFSASRSQSEPQRQPHDFQTDRVYFEGQRPTQVPVHRVDHATEATRYRNAASSEHHETDCRSGQPHGEYVSIDMPMIFTSQHDTPHHDHTRTSVSEPPLTLQDVLPPRRILPFAKSASKSPACSGDLAPLPKPRFIEDQNNPEVYGANRPRSSAVVGGYEDTYVLSSRSSHTPTLSTSNDIPAALPTHSEPRQSSIDRSQHSRFDESMSYGKKSAAPSRHYNSDSVQTANSNEVDRIFANPSLVSDLDGARPRQQAAGYAAQSYEEKMKVLNMMICESLEDENFRALCSDLDHIWRWRVIGEKER